MLQRQSVWAAPRASPSPSAHAPLSSTTQPRVREHESYFDPPAQDRSHPTLTRTCVEQRNARGRVWNIIGMETFEPTREQRAVIEHEGSHLLVFAGPGTGKTETLARRFAWLVAERGVAPDEILL